MLGVRGLLKGDPYGWYKTFEYDAAVIECRDGDSPVLIASSAATPRRYSAPWPGSRTPVVSARFQW
ncbi:hypothetical protein OG244_29085 [Streptomyces brevispora]|uniref:hypothetical protein n=1 Tax=Streptomyces brevispora TaxID=887462 RepID=UPI002E36D9D0|nr:hypothetical protein [Streptomyces brevispora]